MDDRQDFPSSDLAQLVGSRLCHDLVNPISAIANGLELLALSGAAPTPEIELIGDAVKDALARIRFFRIAFGAARPGETISARETREVLAGLYGIGRLEVKWQVAEDLPRSEVKLGFLILNTAETAFPLGGTLCISRRTSGWQLTGTGRKMSIEDPNWVALMTPGLAAAPPPARVQFSLLAQEITARGGDLTVTVDQDSLSLAIDVTD
jgi:histidine phosphotransferase ChpT